MYVDKATGQRIAEGVRKAENTPIQSTGLRNSYQGSTPTLVRITANNGDGFYDVDVVEAHNNAGADYYPKLMSLSDSNFLDTVYDINGITTLSVGDVYRAFPVFMSTGTSVSGLTGAVQWVINGTEVAPTATSTLITAKPGKAAVDETNTVDSAHELLVHSDDTIGALYLVNVSGFLEVYYNSSTDSIGSSWNTPVQIDSTYVNGNTFVSGAIVDGKPAAAWSNSLGSYELAYSIADDATGTTWGTPVVVTSGGSSQIWVVGVYVVDGNPAILYNQTASPSTGGNYNYDLYYVRAADSTGSSWGSPINVATRVPYQKYGSTLNVVDGRPAIVYIQDTGSGTTARPQYLRADDSTGSSWAGSVSQIDASGNSGWGVGALHDQDGLPLVIAGRNVSHSRRGTTADGGTWNGTLDNDVQYFSFSGTQYLGRYSVLDGCPTAYTYNVSYFVVASGGSSFPGMTSKLHMGTHPYTISDRKFTLLADNTFGMIVTLSGDLVWYKFGNSGISFVSEQ